MLLSKRFVDCLRMWVLEQVDVDPLTFPQLYYSRASSSGSTVRSMVPKDSFQFEENASKYCAYFSELIWSLMQTRLNQPPPSKVSSDHRCANMRPK